MGEYDKVIKGETRSLDHSSCELIPSLFVDTPRLRLWGLGFGI